MPIGLPGIHASRIATIPRAHQAPKCGDGPSITRAAKLTIVKSVVAIRHRVLENFMLRSYDGKSPEPNPKHQNTKRLINRERDHYSEVRQPAALGARHRARRFNEVERHTDFRLDRRPYDRCGHRYDMHVSGYDGSRTCVVCSLISQRFPCSRASLLIGENESHLQKSDLDVKCVGAVGKPMRTKATETNAPSRIKDNSESRQFRSTL